jgi:hypothetical protein
VLDASGQVISSSANGVTSRPLDGLADHVVVHFDGVDVTGCAVVAQAVRGAGPPNAHVLLTVVDPAALGSREGSVEPATGDVVIDARPPGKHEPSGFSVVVTCRPPAATA